MRAKVHSMDFRTPKRKGCGGPPKRTFNEMAEELGTSPGMLHSLVARYPEGYPQGSKGSAYSATYFVRSDFRKWYLGLPLEVRQKAEAG